jgi:hypothetical protein
VTRLTPPKATPRDIENALQDKNEYIRAAISAFEGLDIDVILAVWDDVAAEVRAHTPPTVFDILQSFTNRLVRLRPGV